MDLQEISEIERTYCFTFVRYSEDEAVPYPNYDFHIAEILLKNEDRYWGHVAGLEEKAGEFYFIIFSHLTSQEKEPRKINIKDVEEYYFLTYQR